MRSLGTNLPLSTWLQTIRAQIGYEVGEHFEFKLSVMEAARFMDVLGAASSEAARLEQLAAQAPQSKLPDNVLQFRPRPRVIGTPAGGGAA